MTAGPDPADAGHVVPFAGGQVFVELVDLHYRQLYIFGLSLAHNEADAADLVQETFTRWARKGRHVTDPAKARSWLYRTLYRAWIDTVRRRRRLEPLPGPDDVELSTPANSRREADGRAVLDALSRLPEDFRLPLVLYYLQDCSYREIASIAGVPLGTVMSRLSRGKKRLAELLGVRGA